MLETINAIADSIAAFGVIAGLIFVGIQIRQNTRAVRAQSFHAITDSFNAVNFGIAGNAQAASVTRRGFGGMQNLTEDEQLQFSFIALSAMRVMETLYYQSSIGVAERKLWDAELKTIAALMSFPGTRQWWAANPLSFTTEFRKLVNDIIASLPPPAAAQPAPQSESSP